MAKVWKAYIKKHGQAPDDAHDLMFFSQKSRTVTTLTLADAKRTFNSHVHKEKPSGSKKKKNNDATHAADKKKASDHAEKDKDTAKKKKKESKATQSKKKEKAAKTKDSKSKSRANERSNKSKEKPKNGKNNKLSSKPKNKNASSTTKKRKSMLLSSTEESAKKLKSRQKKTTTDKQKTTKKADKESLAIDPKLLNSANSASATTSASSPKSSNSSKAPTSPKSPKTSKAAASPKAVPSPRADAFPSPPSPKTEPKTVKTLHSDDENQDSMVSANGHKPTSPKTPIHIDQSVTTKEEQNANENDNDDTFQIMKEDDDTDEVKEGISTKSQSRAAAFAMFQSGVNREQTEKQRSMSPEPMRPKNTQKVTKKGKRYADFRKFASGAFSVVYKAKDRQNNDTIVAIKKIHIGGSLIDNKFEPTTKEEGDNEVRILKLVNNHKNTCNLMDTYFDHQLGVNAGYVLCIVMEYVPCTLKERMEFYAEKGKNIPFELLKIYLFQLCKAVNHMHMKRVCHRDIKPENVLVDPDTNRLQLCDFGCSVIMKNKDDEEDTENDTDYDYDDFKEEGNETYVMSRFYRAPELILGNRFYDTTADLWSLGVVFGELFLGTILFMGSNNMDQLKEIVLKLGWPTKNDFKDMNPEITDFEKVKGLYGVDKNTEAESWELIFCGVEDMEESAVEIISEILIYSPDDRLTALECLNHEYFDDVSDLMEKCRKKQQSNKKMKKEQIVPLDLFEWTEEERKYAKLEKESLRE